MATPIITEVSYAELEGLITEGLLEPGLQYKITDFATVHWLYDGNYVTEEPPAPGNILIVPDAVGSNPITYYYRVVYIIGEGEARSQFSAEGSYTEGDSTTETLFSCDAIPSWATQVFIIRGTESEVYNESFAFENNNQDIFDRFDSAEGIYETALAVSLYPLKIVKTAEPESLIVTAISTNAIAKQVQSVEHPSDIIEYYLSAEYVSYCDIHEFWDSNLNLQELVPGFKGVITRRKDTSRNIDMPFDWRNIWYRTWNINQPAWSDAITYHPTNKSDAIGDFVTHRDCIFWCILECTDVEPGVDEGWDTFWIRLVNLTDSFFGSYIAPTRQGLYHPAISFVSEGVFSIIPIVDLEEYEDIRAIEEGEFVRDVFHGGSQYIPRIIIGEDSGYIEFGEAVTNVMIGSSCSVISIGQASGGIFIGSNSHVIEIGSGADGLFFITSDTAINVSGDVIAFGDDCSNIDITHGLILIFGDSNSNMTFDERCSYMTFGSNCGGMTFGSGCGGMTFGSSCGGMTFGSNCGGMTFGSSCGAMTFGLGCNTMTFGSSCYTMTFGSSCGAMTFGSNCGGMTFGSYCGTMTFGSNCNKMTFGSGCNTMTFGSNCNIMTFGSNCNRMTFGSGCNTMTFGSGCGIMTFPDYTAFNDFKDGVGNVDFTSEGVIQHDDGSSITHQLVSVDSSIEVVQSYLEWNTDHYEMCYTTNRIGVYQD